MGLNTLANRLSTLATWTLAKRPTFCFSFQCLFVLTFVPLRLKADFTSVVDFRHDFACENNPFSLNRNTEMLSLAFQ